MKHFIAWLMVGVFLFGMLACGAAHSAGPNTIHMSATDFVQKQITITAGQRIIQVADGGVAHYPSNGTYVGNMGKPATELGAPVLTNQEITGGNSVMVGPFTAAGTFHYYCTIHPGMQLTVIVND